MCLNLSLRLRVKRLNQQTASALRLTVLEYQDRLLVSNCNANNRSKSVKVFLTTDFADCTDKHIVIHPYHPRHPWSKSCEWKDDGIRNAPHPCCLRPTWTRIDSTAFTGGLVAYTLLCESLNESCATDRSYGGRHHRRLPIASLDLVRV